MAPLEFVTINAQEDKLGPSTPAPRTAVADIPVPKAPGKQAAIDATPVLVLNDATTDFAINCLGGTLRAHKSVLRTRAPYFSRMFHFNGTETSNKEVNLPDVSRRTMKYALDFMYTYKYTIPGGEIVSSTDFCNHDHALCEPDAPMRARIFKRKCKAAGQTLAPSHLLPHIHVYALADYLGMIDLKKFARRGVCHVLHVYWKDDRIKWKTALEAAFSGTPEFDRGVRIPFIGTIQDHPGLWVDKGPISVWLAENRDTWIKLAID